MCNEAKREIAVKQINIVYKTIRTKCIRTFVVDNDLSVFDILCASFVRQVHNNEL